MYSYLSYTDYILLTYYMIALNFGQQNLIYITSFSGCTCIQMFSYGHLKKIAEQLSLVFLRRLQGLRV